MTITSTIYETFNCSSVESCKAMEFVHEYMEENCTSETTKVLEAIFVDFDSNGSITFTL